MSIKPENRARYPKDWKQVCARIFERAPSKCGWVGPETGPRGGAAHGATVCRLKERPEKGSGSHSSGRPCRDGFYAVKIVLTVAHLNHTPEDNRDGNMRALCLLHYLRHDARYHAREAARARKGRKAARLLWEVSPAHEL